MLHISRLQLLWDPAQVLLFLQNELRAKSNIYDQPFVGNVHSRNFKPVFVPRKRTCSDSRPAGGSKNKSINEKRKPLINEHVHHYSLEAPPTRDRDQNAKLELFPDHAGAVVPALSCHRPRLRVTANNRDAILNRASTFINWAYISARGRFGAEWKQSEKRTRCRMGRHGGGDVEAGSLQD